MSTTHRQPNRASAPHTRRVQSAPTASHGRTRHGMTAAQTSLYWREWAAVRRVLISHGYDAAEADAMRHQLSDDALTMHVSSRHLSNGQFDLVLGAFRAVSSPSDLNAQLDAINGPRRRLLHGLASLIAGREDYVRAILADMPGTHGGDWTRLPDADLAKLRKTLAHRLERKGAAVRRQEPEASHQPADADIPF